MRIDPATGTLDVARQCPSLNCDDRPAGAVPELIVIHNISLPPGEFGGSAVDEFFCNRLDFDAHPYFQEIAQMRVSAHLLIRRDGEIVQYVPFHRRAWHAGVSHFAGRESCNDFAIGIELEGTDDLPYEEVQYDTLAQVVASLIACYPQLSRTRLVGHCDIAPERKTDPGPAFNWAHLRGLVDARCEEPDAADDEE